MKNDNLIDRASEYFKDGDYSTALNLYKEAVLAFGKGLFDYNISQCEGNIVSATTAKGSLLNEYFDKIYIVNLEHQTGNRIKVVNQLKKLNIKYELFTATNGYVGEPLKKWDEYISRPLGSLERYNDFSELEIKRGKKLIESAGAIGYIFTYLQILGDAKAQGLKRILILEDDIIFARDFEAKFKKFVSEVSSDWKILQLGASQHGWEGFKLKNAKRDGFYKPRRLKTFGSFAVAFDLSIVDQVIEAEAAFEAPFDSLPMGELYEKYKGKCFVAYPNLVMPDVTDSSIRGSRCQYEHSKRVKWTIDNFIYPYPKPSVALVVSSKHNLQYFSNFSSPNKSEVDLRIYRTSSDGLRPVHHAGQLSNDYSFQVDIVEKAPLPKADFYGLVDPGLVLTEDIISSFVGSELAFYSKPSEKIKRFNANVTPKIAGKVSVIVPTYQSPSNLRTTISSVLEQDYKDFEIIIVNDNGEGSEYNGETDAVVDSLERLDPFGRINYVKHSKNRNGAAARKTGIMRARGEYISFLDDDMYLPRRLLDCVSALKGTNNRYGAAYCGFLGWNSPQNDVSRYKQGNLTKDLLLLDYVKHYLHGNTVTYKNDAVFALNGFDESYRRHQDLEFNLRFFELYETLVTKTSGVRLNPAPSGINNKVFDASMLKLKEKFLTQFKEHITQTGAASEVYSVHWNEIIRYARDESALEEYLKSSEDNGPLHIALKMNKLKCEVDPK